MSRVRSNYFTYTYFLSSSGPLWTTSSIVVRVGFTPLNVRYFLIRHDPFIFHCASSCLRQTMLFQPSSSASRGLLPICCLNVFLLPLLSLDLVLLPSLSSRSLYVQCIWRIRFVSQQSFILLMCL